jgi:hypothetical protein
VSFCSSWAPPSRPRSRTSSRKASSAPDERCSTDLERECA